MKRTQEELKKALDQQIRFLQNSCITFDSGDEAEALRIATTLRVLLHDTPKSQSLLGQLSVKSDMKFLDSASPIDAVKTGELHKGREVMSISGMPGLFAVMPTVGGVKYIAIQDMGVYARGYISFDEWWNDGCISGYNKIRHSRSWLVKEMANKEGGAHVDPEITQGYAELQATSMGMTVMSNGISGFINSAADVSIRKIAWETLESLKNAGVV